MLGAAEGGNRFVLGFENRSLADAMLHLRIPVPDCMVLYSTLIRKPMGVKAQVCRAIPFHEPEIGFRSTQAADLFNQAFNA